MLRMPGGNPLALPHGQGTRGELRAVAVYCPEWRHFSTLIGKAVSIQVHGSSGWWPSLSPHTVSIQPHLSQLPTRHIHTLPGKPQHKTAIPGAVSPRLGLSFLISQRMTALIHSAQG